MFIPLKIAVDFDGTIVEHRYPEIGKEILFAFDTLKALQKQGHQLILWTYRSGKELHEAVEGDVFVAAVEEHVRDKAPGLLPPGMDHAVLQYN